MIEKKYYKTKDYVKVKFTLTTDAKKVDILGLNNEWKKGVSMTKKKEGVFSAELNLPKETSHEFKYFLDKNIFLFRFIFHIFVICQIKLSADNFCNFFIRRNCPERSRGIH